ncbi:hypothetical protein L211DRAFT_835868 [Terfezia boudieri ATCC MYA-4762]|uniref:Uncharacterized protein n=1 Tax=Terfezia boudieri ATCC MYA-4762 TaxID=1051890 RepID=A0A3N4LSD2_9PEZI|nr:hypothetical protein L211DRAFT_835868 [Terfezia boudieri ATCC MYA-4762]
MIQRLSKYYRERVNHLEKCGQLRVRYLELMSEVKIKGYLFHMKYYTQAPVENRRI